MSVLRNVLSIDMDYIMAPCIQLYNDQWTTVENNGFNPITMGGQAYWDKIEDLIGINDFLCYDEKKLEFIKNLATRIASEVDTDHIYFGKEHDSILTFLCQDKDKADMVYNVYNIDHHHDIYYNTTQKQNVNRFGYAGMSDWVWYLYTYGKLNKYYWINNERSKWGMVNKDDLKLNAFLNFKKYMNDPSPLENIKFDYLYICKSENYVPPVYYHFYEDLRKELSTIKGTNLKIDSEPYAINNGSRFPIAKD